VKAKSLAFDPDVVQSVIQNVEVLKELFRALMRKTAPDYVPLARLRRHGLPSRTRCG
jgi:type I restriction enzyme, R subunit